MDDKLRAIIPALIVALLVMLAGWQYAAEQLTLHRQQERIEVERQASQFRSQLETLLNSRLLLVQGLAAFAKADPGFSEEAFQRFAAKLSEHQTYVRSLQFAPGAVVKHVYPLEGNKSIIGHDLTADPDRFGAVQRAIDERRFILSGPVQLLQGGSAIIGRLPIYIDDHQNLEVDSQFWGFATILLEISPMIDTLLASPVGNGLDVVLRGIDGVGDEVFFGQATVYQQYPVINEISLPDGSWQLAVIPAGGWEARPANWLVYMLTLVIASLGGWLVYSSLLLRATGAMLLKAKEKAVQSERIKSDFLATMSHELRTPLNGVIGMSELLSETKQTPTQRQYSDIISSSANVLLVLINDILDLTKITDNKLIFEKEAFDLDQLLSECSSNFLPLMLEKKLPLYTVIDTKVPLKLIGDQFRLRQLLFNLLSNALKFTDTGFVKVEVKSSASDDESITHLSIAIKDTGIGIDPDALQSIFQQFIQADASTTRRFGGTGLGLSITRSIVESMGGEIKASSSLGQGSIFTLLLPLVVDRDAESRRKASLVPLQGKRILGITDHPAIFTSMADHLMAWGVEIEHVNSVSDAMEKIASHEYDALVIYFSSIQWPDFSLLNDSNMPLLILHSSTKAPENIHWHARLQCLHIPAAIQSIASTMMALFEEDGGVNEASPKISPPALLGDRPVLLVDDNPTNQLVAAKMLSRYGITVDMAVNGAEALDMAGQREYELIFMDCEMPVMDGFSASRKILALGRQPLIVALTAHVMEGVSQRCKDAGMSYVLHKPLTIAELDKLFAKITKK